MNQHRYNIEMIENGIDNVKKGFKTRKEANQYLDNYLTRNCMNVNEVYYRCGNIHAVEYVCDQHHRFVIERA